MLPDPFSINFVHVAIGNNHKVHEIKVHSESCEDRGKGFPIQKLKHDGLIFCTKWTENMPISNAS